MRSLTKIHTSRCRWLAAGLVLIGAWIGNSPRLIAQQDAHHTQYLFNGLVINPAYAGSRGTLAGTFFYRKQWMGFEGAPETQSFSAHLPGGQGRYGFGLTLINDRIGYLGQQWVQGSYAFCLRAGPGKLALGLQGGLLNFRIRWNEVQALDQVDAVFAQETQAMLLPNVGTGLYYYTERFYLGASAPHLLESRLLNPNPARAQLSRLYRHFYLTGGYVVGLNNSVQWKPSFLVKYIPGFPLQADFNLMALLRKKYWLGLSYRTGDAVSAMMDFQIAKHFRLGYSFDYTISGLSGLQSGTHELYLGFEVINSKSKYKSPRYF